MCYPAVDLTDVAVAIMPRECGAAIHSVAGKFALDFAPKRVFPSTYHSHKASSISFVAVLVVAWLSAEVCAGLPDAAC